MHYSIIHFLVILKHLKCDLIHQETHPWLSDQFGPALTWIIGQLMV